MEMVSAKELRRHLKDYLDRLERGEEVTIIRNSMVIGSLVPSEAALKMAEQRSDNPVLAYEIGDAQQVKFRRLGIYENPEHVQRLHLEALGSAGALVGNRTELDVDLNNPSSYYEKLGGEFWVGEIDGQVVAMGAFKLAQIAEAAELKRLRVSPELQGRGIGSALLKFLESRAKQVGYKSMVLDVTTADEQAPARRLYESNGYKEFDRRKFEDYENIYYRKEL
ncbi:MAG: GNAT family N-acetyltransferase [Patescibacteria group bacterium]|mgnify:FL=1